MNINEHKTDKDKLRNAIRTVLAGSILVSGMANAVLRDHGPLNATWFPDWYRDTNGLAMGQCIYADDGGNGPLCLTGPADSNPNGFAGNIGDEAFYSATDVTIPISGGSFLWLGHLEMAYGSASGSPPAVRTATTPATEIVFSRERMRIDLPTTNDGSCSGVYTIRTPFAVHTFELEEGPRALFYTDDIQPIMGDYNAVLAGHTGPFLTWDVGGDGVNPVSSANPVVSITPPVGPVRKYVGDPNQLHTFVGSTIPAGAGHLDKGFNNYVEITPPTLCDLGAGAGVALFEDTAAISGLMWDLPIADPTNITKATYTRDGTTAGLDVWASASKNQNLVLTAADSGSQHLPSVTMSEETKDGAVTGFYHAHLEFDPNQTLPNQVSVANLSSNPVARDKAVVVDEVVVTKSTYDSASKKLCITAHSGDENTPVPLRLEAPGYGAFGAATAGCPVVAGNDVVLEKDLNDFIGDFRLPPEGILIKSDKGGQETSQPSMIRKGIPDGLNVRAVDDVFTGVEGTGVTSLNLVDANPAIADTAPTNHRIVVVSQPEIGTVTAPDNGGSVSYQAVEGMPTSTQSFYYAIQDTTDETVSNVAKVELGITQVIPPPVGVADRQGVFRTSAGSTINVLANDVTGLTNTAIDPNSIQIATAPARGTATVANGAITYTPVGQSGTATNTLDTFTYTVANVSGSRSIPITVQVVLKSAAEAVAFQRVRFNGGWNIRFTSSYAGAAGAVTLAPTASCALTANPGAPANVGPIGSTVSPTAGANSYVVGGGTPVPSGNNWTVRCTTSSGGFQSRTGTL
ncbi:MAG: Ig-like domain-containing protein [Methyloglobulus sp.]|nr:Ig-like domain-containing protein [Methyloglobulus sp.]